jgi:hypothetical protein
MPNLQTKHRNFSTNIKINAIRIENVKTKFTKVKQATRVVTIIFASDLFATSDKTLLED